MGIEEKVKAYDEALEQAQKELAACGSINCDAARQIFRLFPQLRESEDERIRKILIRIVKGACDKYGIKYKGDEITEEKLIAYLEKQKDHFRDDTKKVEKQDYSGLNDLERAIHRGFLSAGGKNVPVTIIKETAKECLEQMKPAEWSEEDETRLTNILIMLKEYVIHHYSKDDVNKSVDWLENRFKSLRPQPHWKPSEKQIGALNYAYCELFKREDVGHNILGPLQKLLDNLKKLM